jgi:hypothetical protein
MMGTIVNCMVVQAEDGMMQSRHPEYAFPADVRSVGALLWNFCHCQSRHHRPGVIHHRSMWIDTNGVKITIS